MANDSVILEGTLNGNGRLELSIPVALPPGRVEVTIRSVAPKTGEHLPALLARMRAEQQSSGRSPRTREEIDEQLRQMRDEWEEHQLGIERLQEECRRAKKSEVTGRRLRRNNSSPKRERGRILGCYWT